MSEATPAAASRAPLLASEAPLPAALSDHAYYPRADAARIVAALSICFLHTSGAVGARAGGQSAPQLALHDLSIWALPFFFAVAGYFHAAGSGVGGRSGSWLGRRLLRLAVPFLAFTALYRAWQLQHFHERYSWLLLRHDLIFGTAFAHLWFLPVLVWCCIIVWVVERTGSRGALLGPLVVSTGAAVAFVVISSLAPRGASYAYYLYRTPLFWLLFYVCGWWLARRRGEYAWLSADWPWLALAVGAACLVASRLPGPQQVVALYYIGAGLVGLAVAIVAVRRPGRRPGRLVSSLAAATLGFYLLHFFVLDLFLTYAPLSGWRYGTTLYQLAVYATVTLVTATVVLTARTWRPLRWVFG